MIAHLHGFHGLAELEDGAFVIADGVLELFHLPFFLKVESGVRLERRGTSERRTSRI